MGAIVDFFTGIADAVAGVIDWFAGFLADAVYLVQLTGKFLAQIPSYFSWMPPEMVSMIVTIFGIVVLYKILGREG